MSDKTEEKVMTQDERNKLKDAFWASIEPSVESYSNQIESLLDTLTDEQLQKFVVVGHRRRRG